MAVEVRPGRDAHMEPGAVISVNGNRQARRAPRRQNRMIMLGIGLGVCLRLVRDPRFQAQVITVAIGLAVLKRAAQDSQARTLERMIAWDERHQLPHEGKANTRRA